MKTGSEYVSSLNDGRDVVLKGDRCSDIASHPYLGGQVETISTYYDRQLNSHNICSLRVAGLTKPVPRAFYAPKSKPDLTSLARSFQLQSAATYGHMGRTPDFVASIQAAFADSHNLPSDASECAQSYRDYCAKNDLFVAHAAVNPSTDRSAEISESTNSLTHLKVVDRRSDGIIVSGAKLVSTLAPLADELLVFTLPGYRPEDSRYALGFGIPTNSPGLTFVCREPYRDISPSVRKDHPLALYDEVDATCIFENVFVPNDRLFLDGDTKLANSLFDITGARALSGLHGAIRMVEKTRLLVGVGLELSRLSGVDRFLHVQEMLGEMIGSLELVMGAAERSLATASCTDYGFYAPNTYTIQALRYYYPKLLSRLIEIIQTVGGASLTTVPSIETLESPWGPQARFAFKSRTDHSADERIQILKLAWDIVGDSTGMRHLQYERYSNGDPVRLAATQFKTYSGNEVLRKIAQRAAGLSVV